VANRRSYCRRQSTEYRSDSQEANRRRVTPHAFEHYPWSHSLLMVIVAGALAGGAYALLRGDRRGGSIIASLAVSHWVLDAVTHRPDLPLHPGGEAMVGLGLWNSVAATLLVEGVIFAAGVWLYTRATQATSAAGRWGLWSLVAFLVVIHLANAFGPPPPSITAVALAAFAMWLLLGWAGWADSRREVAG
jgi:hypothetical protein